MGFLFLVGWQERIPSFHQFFDSANINISVVKDGFQAGHVPYEEPAVLPHRVTAKRAEALCGVFRDEFNGLSFRIFAAIG